MKVRDVGLISTDHVVLLTGNTDVKAVADSIGIKCEMQEYPYIPRLESMVKRNGRGYWYNMDYVEDGLFELFAFTDFIKSVKIYIPKEGRNPPLFLVNEKYHLMLVVAPREEVVE